MPRLLTYIRKQKEEEIKEMENDVLASGDKETNETVVAQRTDLYHDNIIESMLANIDDKSKEEIEAEINKIDELVSKMLISYNIFDTLSVSHTAEPEQSQMHVDAATAGVPAEDTADKKDPSQ